LKNKNKFINVCELENHLKEKIIEKKTSKKKKNL